MARAIFTYHGSEDCFPELYKRTGQVVEVVRPLTKDEADIYDMGPVFRIKFSDGFTNDAFDDELKFIKGEKGIYLFATNIQWDVDCRKNLDFLPSEVQVPDFIDHGDDDAISDWLTDEFGFCHKSFELEYKYKEV